MKLSFSLLVLAWRLRSLLPDGSRLKKLCRVGGIICNAEGFAGETGAVDVLEGGERDTNDLLSCSHYPLKGLAAGRVAGAIPHSDAASQNALDGASVEGAHDGGRGSGSSEFAEEVETLLCFLGMLNVSGLFVFVCRVWIKVCISMIQLWRSLRSSSFLSRSIYIRASNSLEDCAINYFPRSSTIAQSCSIFPLLTRPNLNM